MRKFFAQGAPAWLLAFLLLMIAAVPQPVAAQGLLESLFGFLSPKAAPNAHPKAAPPKSPPRSETVYSSGERRVNPHGQNTWSPAPVAGAGGRYKTVCVRLCDGFYFPINQSSRRRDFYADAQQCQSRCDSETRLYFMSPSETSVSNAQDLHGLSYSKLKTALLYRKTLKEGCDCRPKPWSVAERMRHQTYELGGQELTRDVAESAALKSGSDLRTDAEPVLVSAVPQAATYPETSPVIAPRPVATARSGARIEPPRPQVAVPRRYDVVQYQNNFDVPRPLPAAQRRAPLNKKSSGLGAHFAGSGLPPVRYRHRWPGDTD